MPNQNNILKYFIFLIVLISIICSTFNIYSDSFAQPQIRQDLNLSGKELFIENRCVRCHTIGRGRFVGPDLAGINDRYTKDEIVQWIENPQLIYQQGGKMPVNEGYPPMPPLNIPPEQAVKISDYITTFEVSGKPAEKGAISGQVINKTNDQPASETELVLTSYMGDNPTGDTLLTTDEQGNFLFENLDWDRSYQILINYQGAQYSTDKMVFFPDEDIKILTLPIFDPTFDEDNITVIESHMIVQEEEGGLSVADLTLFNNSGNKIFVGGKELEDGRKESLRFSVPKDAQSVNFIHGVNPADVVETKYGFADTNSVMPGDKRVVYSYGIPLKSSTAIIEKTIEYPTESFLLLISDSERAAVVNGLTEGETKTIQGVSYKQWIGNDLKRGHNIKIELKGPSFKPDFIKWGAIGLLALIILAGVIFSVISRKNSNISENEDDTSSVSSRTNRVELIKEIAFLDDSFEEGRIEEVKYQALRKEKLAQVKKIDGDRDRS